MTSGLTLEVVPSVRATSVQMSPESRNEIGRYERRAPELTLTYMDSLVRSGSVERRPVTAEDHVAEGDGRHAPGEGYAAAEYCGDYGSVNLQNAGHDLKAAALEHGDRNEQQSNERVRQRPQVSDQSEVPRVVAPQRRQAVNSRPRVSGPIQSIAITMTSETTIQVAIASGSAHPASWSAPTTKGVIAPSAAPA